MQLIENEVLTFKSIAEQVVAMMEQVVGPSATPSAASRILELARRLALDSVEQQQALITAGTIQRTSLLMSKHMGDNRASRAGIEAFSGLVGRSWDGLALFAQEGGIMRIEKAMVSHPDDTMIQMKGLRALASGIEWPIEMQRKAKYTPSRCIELTKEAMAKHADDQELTLAGLEALAKYLDQHCDDDVRLNGGEGLVKAVMTKHCQVN